MTQKNEMSARALGMEELENVNGGRGMCFGHPAGTLRPKDIFRGGKK